MYVLIGLIILVLCVLILPLTVKTNGSEPTE